MKEFTIVGTTNQCQGKFGATITMNTPDGKETTIESGFIFLDEETAQGALRQTVDQLLVDAKKIGAVVVSTEEGTVQ